MDNFQGDPDYKSFNSYRELNENEKKEQLSKVKQILEEQFNFELKYRQERIEKLENQIFKVRKLLHLLRYVLIMSYYKKKELEYNNEIETTPFIDSQNRIHPAIKKLLGNNTDILNNVNKVRQKRKLPNSNTTDNNTTYSNITNTDTTISDKDNNEKELEIDCKKIKLVPSDEENSNCSNENSQKENIIVNRQKVKKRLIIGNISKSMPVFEDHLTHKWMVYVRGPKDEPDVSHFIDKVVFHLHPSYKPHDIIEICETPFHLTRRGWGEFPIRVQIYFKLTLNKPVDIVHNIKLDKSCTGRQILGNETLVDLFLYEEVSSLINIKDENELENLTNENKKNEHDYCFLQMQENIKSIKNEHCYYMIPNSNKTKPPNNTINVDLNNTLIYGLKEYLKTGEQYFTQQSIDILTNKYQICIPEGRFHSIGEVLPYISKRLPFFTKLALNHVYKKLYPFTARSLKEYLEWNISKQKNSEWCRAKIIKNIIKKSNIYNCEKWTTKAIIMYERSHKYTPFTTYSLFIRDSIEKQLLLTCYKTNKPKINKQINIIDDDIKINVDTEIDTFSLDKKEESLININIKNSLLKEEFTFVKQTALDCGIVLKNEIIDGCIINGAERMILTATKCFAENLIRRAINYRICNSRGEIYNFINKNDVQRAIDERPEMIKIIQFKKQRKDIEYFT